MASLFGKLYDFSAFKFGRQKSEDPSRFEVSLCSCRCFHNHNTIYLITKRMVTMFLMIMIIILIKVLFIIIIIIINNISWHVTLQDIQTKSLTGTMANDEPEPFKVTVCWLILSKEIKLPFAMVECYGSPPFEYHLVNQAGFHGDGNGWSCICSSCVAQCFLRGWGRGA